MEALWSTLLAVMNLSITFCMSRQWMRVGYWAGIAAQAPWAVWDIASGNVGFLLIGVVTVIINISGLRRLRNAEVKA